MSNTPGRPPGRPREVERDPLIDGVSGYMLDEDGFVLPQYREHVAALRKKPELWDIGEVIAATMTQSRERDE